MKYHAVGGKLRSVGGWHAPSAPPRRLMVEPPDDGIAPSRDLRALAPPVMSQGQVGMCSAEGSLSVREYLILRSEARSRGALSEKDKAAALANHGAPFSRLYQYARTRQREGTPLAADEGASGTDAFATLEDHGACPTSWWSDEDPEERFMLNPGQLCDAEAHRHRVVLSFGLPSLRTVRASLTQGFPVGFGFMVFSGMMSEECSRTGIVHLPVEGEQAEGGHFVYCIGHDDAFEIDGARGALRFRNSWGDGWGSGGDGWLPYRYFEQGYAEDAHTARRADEV